MGIYLNKIKCLKNYLNNEDISFSTYVVSEVLKKTYILKKNNSFDNNISLREKHELLEKNINSAKSKYIKEKIK